MAVGPFCSLLESFSVQITSLFLVAIFEKHVAEIVLYLDYCCRIELVKKQSKQSQIVK